MKRIFLAFSCWLLATGLYATKVSSPNGNIVVTFTVEDGVPTYAMTYKGRDVIKPSHLTAHVAV